MTTVRMYRLVKWLAWRLLRPLGWKDRWGFNLGEDLHDWATIRTFMYLEKTRKLAGFGPVEAAAGPRWVSTSNSTTSSAATFNVTLTRLS